MALVKLYRNDRTMAVAYWVNKRTPVTLESILWKIWRSQFEQRDHQRIESLQPWMNVEDSGDNRCTGWLCNDLTDRLST